MDIMLDDQLTPWLIEVNTSPSCSSSSPIDKKIKSETGVLTQVGQGGRPAPLASRLHRIPTHFRLNLHGI